MNSKLLFKRAFRRIRQVGLRQTSSEVMSRMRPVALDAFDAKYGTDTESTVSLWNCKIESANAVFGHRYQTTTEQEFIDAMRFLPRDKENFTFLDLGCGKGRTLLIASRLGFAKVLGVEFAAEVAAVARHNMAITGTHSVSVLNADAAEFIFPSGDVVLYMYNPFGPEVMVKVIDNLKHCQGRLYVIYRVPEPACSSLIDGALRRIASDECVSVWEKF